jgi:hypothetical protein
VPNLAFKVLQILCRERHILNLKNGDSQQALVAFLEKFHQSREEDEQFADEKQYLIKQIRDLK